jgi:hypothetical protein
MVEDKTLAQFASVNIPGYQFPDIFEAFKVFGEFFHAGALGIIVVFGTIKCKILVSNLFHFDQRYNILIHLLSIIGKWGLAPPPYKN